jgi:hypothetical protein
MVSFKDNFPIKYLNVILETVFQTVLRIHFERKF